MEIVFALDPTFLGLSSALFGRHRRRLLAKVRDTANETTQRVAERDPQDREHACLSGAELHLSGTSRPIVMFFLAWPVRRLFIPFCPVLRN